MNEKTFQIFFKENRDKIFEAWSRLSDEDLNEISGNLNRFLKKISSIYKTPDAVILKELDAVRKNIDEGIDADFALPLDPNE